MDPVLQSLIHFQELSLELGRITARLEQFPLQIQRIDSQVENARGAVAAARAAVADHQKDRRKFEMELQDLETQLKKYNSQLMQVKTNDEYKAMQHEIAGVKDKIGGVEERILALMEEAEHSDRRVKEDETQVEALKKEADSQKAVVLAEQRGVEQEAARVAAQREGARSALSQSVLDLFNRIAQGRNGVALARAREERCQECNVRIRPQIFQEIKRNDRLIQCDSCRRILYYVADAPAADAPA